MDQLLGLRQSIQLIEDILSQNPEIEFIMGFSQGAAFLSLLCQLGIVPDDKKLIFVGGFYPLKYDTLYQKFNHQSTHVYGEADMIILPQYSQDLAQFFNHATIITHKGKHTIPRFKFE
jgi:predicted esterase